MPPLAFQEEPSSGVHNAPVAALPRRAILAGILVAAAAVAVLLALGVL